ncbi:MAG: SPFH domain-containing protein, partial [Phycisphaeraceae bacterium]
GGVLWLLYNQHRLEAAETLEVEQMRESDAAAAALFDEAGDRLAVARKRLERLYRIGLPATALAVGLYLATIGGLLFARHWNLWQRDVLDAVAIGNRTNTALTTLLVLSVGLAFFVFIVARYVAGMTRLDLWRPLRAGAAYLVGATLLLLLLIAASALAYVGYGPAFPLLALIAPAITAVLGVEMLLAFLADLYRPRRKGEIPRPAFDSRLLGWMTSPDSLSKIVAETLRYQFGLDFTSSWFYRLFSRALLPLIGAGVIVLFAMSSLVIVAPHQAAVVTTFGQLERTGDGDVRVYGPGVHLKWPWPVSGIEKHDVHRVHTLNVGSRTEGIKPGAAILWTNEHTIGEEQYLVTAPTRIKGEDDDSSDRQMRGAAGELVGADVAFLFRIMPDRLEDYITSARDPQAVLQTLAEQETSRYFASRTVDQLLTVGRQQAGEAIRHSTQAAVEERELGLELLQVAISAVHPPNDSEVAQAFLEQINARQTKQTTIEEARREAVSIMAQAAGSREFALRINRPIQREEALLREIERLRREAGETLDAETARTIETLREQRRRVAAEIERLIADAGGESAQILARARADRWRQAITEAAAAERFAPQLAAFRQAPRYYAARRYFQAISEAMQNRRKIILGVDTQLPAEIRFNLEDATGALGSVFGEE